MMIDHVSEQSFETPNPSNVHRETHACFSLKVLPNLGIGIPCGLFVCAQTLPLVFGKSRVRCDPSEYHGSVAALHYVDFQYYIMSPNLALFCNCILHRHDGVTNLHRPNLTIFSQEP
jgi:hypothetical protein